VVGGGGVAPPPALRQRIPAGAEAGLHPLGGEVEGGAGVEPEILTRGAVVNRRLADELQPAGAVGLEEAYHAAGERPVAQVGLPGTLHRVEDGDRRLFLLTILAQATPPGELAAEFVAPRDPGFRRLEEGDGPHHPGLEGPGAGKG